MTATVPIPPITGAVTVGLPVDLAFRVFTGEFTAWWPHQYHIGQADVAEVILEPQEGAAGSSRGSTAASATGAACSCGRRRAGWCLPGRSTAPRQFDPDPDHATEIEVLFAEDGPGQTRVEVEHRHFDRLVDGRGVHDAIRGGGGWALLLEGYAKVAANAR